MKKILLILLCLHLSACSSIFFFPMKGYVRTPEHIGIEYKEITLSTKDNVNIHGWFLPTPEESKGTIYFLHGNAENISTHLQAVYWLPKNGYQVFLIDYRGFGLSEGVPNLPNALIDIETGFNWLLKQEGVAQKPLFLMGQSLGASISIYFAATNKHAKHCLHGVISDAAFTRYSDIFQHVASQSWLTWLLQYPASWVVVSGYDPIDYINAISPTPILIIHSQDDNVIPLQHARKLFDRASERKLNITTKGQHGATFNDKKNKAFLLKFLETSATVLTTNCLVAQ